MTSLSSAPVRSTRRRERPAPERRTVRRRRIDGSVVDEIVLDPEIFGLEPRPAVLHQVVTAQLAAARSGTQSTRTHAEVSGGGAKPFRQKGTGRARQGSTRSPQSAGGGVASAQAPFLPPAHPEEDDPPGPVLRAVGQGHRGEGCPCRGLDVRGAQDEGCGLGAGSARHRRACPGGVGTRRWDRGPLVREPAPGPASAARGAERLRRGAVHRVVFTNATLPGRPSHLFVTPRPMRQRTLRPRRQRTPAEGAAGFSRRGDDGFDSR